MGSCMSSPSTSRASQARALDPGARSSRRWRRGGGGDRGGLLGKWVGQAKALSRRGFGEDLPGGAVGRMVLGGSSGAACLFTQQGRKGPNQDAMVVWENFTSREDTVFCGIFDGHGPFGHMVAKKVRDTLPVKLCSQWKAASDCNSTGGNASCEENAPVNAEDEWVEFQESGSEQEKFPQVYGTLRQSLLKAFKLMDKELKLHPAIDCFCSGSTAVTLVKQGRDIIIGNVGDSRAVLGTRDRNNNMIAVQLTVDLKPNLPGEAARIQRCKGRVFALQDEPEVPRVWLPNSDSPGLAMARAFGDFCLKDYGLISVPDISYRHLTDQDEFIVMATDGVWDVLSNKEVVDIVATAPTRSSAARMLVECATSEWQIKFPTSKIDDCAVICLFLNRPSASSRVQETVPPQLSSHCAEPTASGSAYQGSTDVQASLDGFELHGNALQEMFPPVGIDEILIEGSKDSMPLESVESMRLPDPTSEEEWTALDGVTRVNTLLNLPRFRSGDGRMVEQKD